MEARYALSPSSPEVNRSCLKVPWWSCRYLPVTREDFLPVAVFIPAGEKILRATIKILTAMAMLAATQPADAQVRLRFSGFGDFMGGTTTGGFADVSAREQFNQFGGGEADPKNTTRGFGVTGTDFADDRFHNTGVLGEDRGRAALDRGGDFADRPYPFFQTHKAFKTPGLKNVALTAPYFHDGSEQTLKDVVRFYNDGGREYISAATSPEIRPLGLSDREIGDIVAFLRALTAPVDFEIPRIPSAEDHFEPKDFELDASGSSEPR